MEPTIVFHDKPSLWERFGTYCPEGFGSKSIGGAGGRIISVTNLEDSDSGSLREALEAEGPRIVVFEIDGIVELESVIRIENPYLSILGQSTPIYGITIKNSPSNKNPPVYIDTHDIIVQHLRIRPGPSEELSSSLDALELSANSYNIMIDHCSLNWATDENLLIVSEKDITIQWCIIAYGLHDSTHTKGTHSHGIHMWGGVTENISMHHNLIAHNFRRNPTVEIPGPLDFVNNVIYNFDWHAFELEFPGVIKANIVGNYVKPGPDNDGDAYFIAELGENGQHELYVKGNIMTTRRPTDDLSEDLVVEPSAREYIVDDSHEVESVTTTSAFDAYEDVLEKAGATLPFRDRVDRNLIDEVKKRTGNIIDHPSEVGGWSWHGYIYRRSDL